MKYSFRNLLIVTIYIHLNKDFFYIVCHYQLIKIIQLHIHYAKKYTRIRKIFNFSSRTNEDNGIDDYLITSEKCSLPGMFCGYFVFEICYYDYIKNIL